MLFICIFESLNMKRSSKDVYMLRSKIKHLLFFLEDFRTTVEYIIKLLETKEYQNNRITTGWLDKLISENVQAEKPDVMLGVISGALHI